MPKPSQTEGEELGNQELVWVVHIQRRRGIDRFWPGNMQFEFIFLIFILISFLINTQNNYYA